MNINTHPVWKNVSRFKQPLHLLRIHLARQLIKLYPRSRFIGVTGTVGKTSTVQATQLVLAQKYKTVSTKENLDPIFNLPITLLSMRPGVKKMVLEMGIEYPGEMDFYLTLVRPATGVVTRVAYQHSEFLGGVEEITAEKSKLISSLPKDGFAILNYDDHLVRRLADKTEARVIFFGTKADKCHVFAGNINLDNWQTVFELNFGVERVEVRLNLVGKHFVTSALAAAAVGISCGLSLINIKKGLEKLTTPEHRLQVLEGISGFQVIDDTYNASPVSVEEALNLVAELPARRRILVLGEMRELGAYNERMHRGIAQKILKDKVADLVLLSTGNTNIIADELVKLGFPQDRIEVNLSHSQIVSQILRVAKKGDLVLVKGARAVKLEEVVQRISKR